jgi:hypothetical protein
MQHFARSIGLTHSAATHTAQKYFQQTEADSKDFNAMMTVNLEGKIHMMS